MKTDKITELAKQKSEKRQKEVLNAIKKMKKAGEPVSFYSVQKKTGASKSYLYNNEAIASAIKEARTLKTEPISPDSEKTVIMALRKKVKDLEKQLDKEREANSDSYREKCIKLQAENEQLKEQLKKAYVTW